MQAIMRDEPEIEYLDGRPHPKISPKTRHSFVQGALGSALRAAGRTRGFSGPEWRFEPGAIDGSVTEFVPDLAFVYRERMLGIPPGRRDKLPFSPDIAIEIRSPRDNLRYLRDKIARYLRTGAVLVLDVDPVARTIAAHAASGTREYRSGDRFSHEAVPWFTFEVAEIFADLDVLENG